MAGLKFLPEARWNTVEKSVVPRESLNRSASPADERQLTVAADNAPIRVIYGRDRIGAQIANVLLHGNYWVFQAVWGEGECDAIEEVTFDDAALPTGTLSTHYAGTAGQTVNSWLVDAFAAKGQTYSDALPGICYSVFKVPTSAIDGFPQITALIRGRKVAALHPFNLEDRFTITSSQYKTYFDDAGLLQTNAANGWPDEYDPVTGDPVGKTVWESRTNLLVRSEEFDNAAWTKTSTTISANDFLAPDGTLTADKLISDTSNAIHQITGVVSPTAGTYTFSIFAKAAEETVLVLIPINQSAAFSPIVLPNALFNLATGTVAQINGGGASNTTASITSVGGGWYRCSCTVTSQNDSTAGPTLRLRQTTAYTGDGTSGIYIWGAQLEAGAFATPYIKTEGTTITRAADVAVMTGTNFSDWYNATESTAVLELTAQASGTRVYASWSDGTTNERIRVQSVAGALQVVVTDGGVDQATLALGTVTSGTRYKVAAAWKADDFAASVNGGAVVTDTSGTLPTVNRLHIGSDETGSSQMCGNAREFIGHPARLSNAELEALSAPGASYLDASVQPTLVLDFINQVYLISATQHTSNPSRVLADFLANSTFGASRSVDWASVVTAALANDEVVGGQPRRKIGLTIDTVQDVYQWAATLRTYAGCWLHEGSNGLRLIPDRPASSVASYDHANGDIMAISSMRLRPVTDAPTVMTIRYTDTSVTPWKDAKVTVYAPGAEAGTVPRRESEVALPGIHSKAQAYREAVERLNKLTLSDLSFELTVRDIGIRHEIGDVIDVTHPIGLTAKLMRIVGISGEDGRYRLQLTEYDAAAYSDAVQTEPSSPDTSLPDPGAPVAVTDLVLSEEVFQQQDGTYSSRIRANWTAPDFPASFMAPFIIRVQVGGAVVFTGTAAIDATTWASPAVQEGVLHQVDVVTTSRTGASSTAASSTITPAGKSLIPGNVPALNGFEVGGEVRLSWSPAVDLDIWRYEVRYVASAGTWADGTLIDRTDALRLVTKDIPAGTWDFMVKAIDSVGQYSTTEARRTITVTLDAAAFLVDSHDFTTPTLSNMTQYALGRTDTTQRYVTDDGVAWNTKFSSAMNTYTNALLSYSTTASSLTTESYDFGLSLSGNWLGELTVTNIAGTADETMELGPNGSSWTSYPMTAKTGARWARLKATGTSGEVFIVEIPTASVRIDAVPRTEDGSSTSSATLPTTITLSNSYAAVKYIGVIPTGTAARIATVDNIVVGATTTFDVYIFDAAGTQVANGFQWTFNGV